MQRVRSLVLTVLLMSLMATLSTPGALAKAPYYSASLSFYSTDRIGCMETRLWLDAGRTGDGTTFLDIDITMADQCYTEPSQRPRLNAYYRTYDYQLDAHPRLGSASLSATVPVVSCNYGLCDWVGSELYVQITLTGNGDLTSDPGSSITRPVVATGSITGRWDQNLIPDASTSGYLSRLKG
jgi:hypothetical protein